MAHRALWIPIAASMVVALAAMPACDLTLDDDTSDDDTWPDYEGTIDMNTVDADITCAEDPDDYVFGDWDIIVFFDGWAAEAWVEMWSENYCEGYDSETGDPCEYEGTERPGWDMNNYDYGWDGTSGFWDSWDLLLPFDGESWPPSADTSYFTCDDAFEFYFCACDDATDECFCSPPWIN